MHPYFLVGLLLAVLSGLLAAVSGPLSLESTWPLLLGAGVMLAPKGRLGARMAALVLGLAAGWAGFALRAAILPDVPVSRGIAVAVPVLLVAVAALLSRNRLPLWVGLLGVAGFTGAYEAKFLAAPTDFIAGSFATMTSVLLAAALGAVTVAVLSPRGLAPPSADPPEAEPDDATAPTQSTVSEEAAS